jgi:trehalose-6-phosphatase
LNTSAFDACICIGDDRTDETMFRANSGQSNVRIGRSGPSLASLFISDTTETKASLERVLQQLGSGGAEPDNQSHAKTRLQPC